MGNKFIGVFQQNYRGKIIGLEPESSSISELDYFDDIGIDGYCENLEYISEVFGVPVCIYTGGLFGDAQYTWKNEDEV